MYMLIYVAWEVPHNPGYWVCVSWHHKRALWAKNPNSGFCTQSCGCETKHGFDGLIIVASGALLKEPRGPKATMGVLIE